MACLDENQVVALVQGKLSGDELRRAQMHLDECEDCLELVGMFQQATMDDATLDATLDPALDPTRNDDHIPLTASLQLDLSVKPGTQIGRYEVVRSIGRGGMGVVYLARDPQLDRAVALKLVRPSLQEDERAGHFERRLMREARAMAKLSHPNVLTIYDVGLHGEQVFLASEWIDGCTLEEWMSRGPHRWRSVVKRFAAAARGLAAAHREGLVHRDFKPSNVMLGKDDRVLVFDFGLVKASQPSVGDITTQLSGQFVVGTPAYMAPEQMTGDVADERSDQFSFCVALYEALSGSRPFAGRNITELLSNISEGQFDEIKKVPKWLSDMLRRGLSRKPNDRHDSMRTIADLMDRGIRHSKRRSALAIGAFGTAAVLAASLGYWGGHSGLGEEDTAGLAGPQETSPSEQELGLDFEKLDALLQVHKYQLAIDTVEAMLPDAQGHRPSEARLWAISARALSALSRYEQAAEAYEKSFYAAVAGRNDKMAALAAAEIHGIFAVRLRDETGAAHWQSLAESAVERSASTEATGTWLRIQGAATLAAGNVDEAIQKYSDSIRVLESSGEEHHALVASATEGLAASLARSGKLEEAKAKAEDALRLWTEHVGANDPNSATAKVRLADILLRMGDVKSARALSVEASHTLIEAYGETHPRVARVLNSMAGYAVQLGDIEAANQELLRSLRIKRTLYGSESKKLVSTLINLMDVDRMRERHGDAVIHGTEAATLLEAGGDSLATTKRLQRTRLSLAEAQLASGDMASALESCRSLYTRFEVLGGVDAVSRGRALTCIGRSLLGSGNKKQGIVELSRALEVFGEEDSPYRGMALFALAQNNADRGAARNQAERAREAFASAGNRWTREHDAVQTWLSGETP